MNIYISTRTRIYTNTYNDMAIFMSWLTQFKMGRTGSWMSKSSKVIIQFDNVPIKDQKCNITCLWESFIFLLSTEY